jgi:uncharacterized membrane protein YphA (DoxX/SURF4 family)
MRALNSTYPNGLPGVGLLLSRLTVGIASVSTASIRLLSGVALLSTVGLALQIASATLLILGLWTPVVGIVLALVEFYGAATAPGHVDLLGLLRASIAVSLVLTGPGARSVDAVAFGRRQIDISEDED